MTSYRLDLPRWDTAWETKTRRDGRVTRRRPVWDALTGNARTAHWGQRATAVYRVSNDVGWLAKAAHIPPTGHMTVRLVWAPGDHRRADPGNLHGVQKACVDALVRVGIVPDDTAEWVTELTPRIDRPPVPAGLWLDVEIVVGSQCLTGEPQ